MHDASSGAERRDEGRGGSAQEAAAPQLGTVPLSERHDVASFVCSRSVRVQAFLRTEAAGYSGINYTKVFVWPDPKDPIRILGYYTLSSCLVARQELSNKHERKAPKGIPVPVALIGYMGKTDGVQPGFGAVLIHDAAVRVSILQENIGIWGLALDAENEGLAQLYKKYGFTAARQKPLFLYGPLGAFLG